MTGARIGAVDGSSLTVCNSAMRVALALSAGLLLSVPFTFWHRGTPPPPTGKPVPRQNLAPLAALSTEGGLVPLCASYSLKAFTHWSPTAIREEFLARCWIPVYATIEIAARIAITTTTMSSSTIVKPLCIVLVPFLIPFTVLRDRFGVNEIRGGAVRSSAVREFNLKFKLSYNAQL